MANNFITITEQQLHGLVQGILQGLGPITTPAQASITTTSEPKIKPREPEPFDGDRSKYRTWKSQMMRYLTHATNATRHHKLTIIMANIRGGRIDEWVNAYAEQHFDVSRGTWNITIDQAWQDLDQAYTDRVAERQALEKLEHLRQDRRAASDFFQEFEMLVMQAGYTTSERFVLEWVKRGINSRYLDSIYMHTPLPQDYDEWKARVILLDDAWAQRQAINAHTHTNRPQQTQRVAPAPQPSKPPSPPVSTRTDGTGTTFLGQGQPMDIDRVGGTSLCWTCGRKRYDGAPGCTNQWHRRGRSPIAPSASATPAPQQTRAAWEEEEFRENVRKWAAADPDSFKAAGFGSGSA